MSRRTHKKSRAGCSRCKRRHIKCDEIRPICANCSIANLECEYATQCAPRSTFSANVGVSVANDFNPRADSPVSAPTANSTTIQASPLSRSPAALTPLSRPLHGTELNLDHIELLHHFCTVTYKTMSPQQEHQETWQVGVFNVVLNF